MWACWTPLVIALPKLELQNVQLIRVGLLDDALYRPQAEPVFPVNTQLTSVGLLGELYIPPPLKAGFPLKVQFISLGLPLALYIPPPYVQGRAGIPSGNGDSIENGSNLFRCLSPRDGCSPHCW